MNHDNSQPHDFVRFHFSLSTAEDEKNYFSGVSSALGELGNAQQQLPSGVYRIVDGELCRIVPGRPPL